MQSILTGEVECNSQIRKLSASWGFCFSGEFKSYFASKIIHAHVNAVSIATVVGPNLEVGRDAGAFNTLFGAALLGELGDAEHIYLLRLVAQEGRSRPVDKVTETMLDGCGRQLSPGIAPFVPGAWPTWLPQDWSIGRCKYPK